MSDGLLEGGEGGSYKFVKIRCHRSLPEGGVTDLRAEVDPIDF